MRALSFGEIMLRLKTPGYLRLEQASSFEASYGGAEANMAVSLSLLGDDAVFVSKLPENPVGNAALGSLRRFGVDTGRVLRGGPRLGVYFFEKGSGLRSTNVIYDRAGSSIATACRSEFNWPALFKGVDCFYFSGVTPALSDELAAAAKDAASYCHAHGIPVVCDLNYRGKLWTPEKSREVMSGLMEYTDVCIANDEDFESALGVHAFDGDLSRCIDQAEQFRAGMHEVTIRWPNCRMVASVLRNIRSAEDGDWMALLLKDGNFYETPIRTVRAMEGVGAGDAFGAALTHCLLHKKSPQETIEFSLAASLLKLTVSGDQNLVTEAEILAAAKKGGCSRLRR